MSTGLTAWKVCELKILNYIDVVVQNVAFSWINPPITIFNILSFKILGLIGWRMLKKYVMAMFNNINDVIPSEDV